MNFIMLLFGKKIGIPIENYMRSKTKRIFFFNQNDGWKKMMEKIDEKNWWKKIEHFKDWQV